MPEKPQSEILLKRIETLESDLLRHAQETKALQARETLLRSVVTHSSAILFVIARDGRFELSEGMGLKSLGLKPGEVVGQSVYDIYRQYPDVIEAVDKALLGELNHCVLAIEDKVFDVTFNPVINSGQKITKIVGVGVDITERQKTEAALHASRERYRGLAEATFEATFIFKNGYCIDANQTATQMFGYQHDELIGLFGNDLIAAESKALARHYLLSGYEEPYEAVARRKDGSTFFAEIRGKMIDYKGQMVRVTVIHDIDKSKRSQLALRDSEEKYRLLFEQSRDAITITTAKGLFLDVNQAFSQMMGYSHKELMAMNAEQLWADPADRQRWQQKIQREGSLVDYECRQITKDGKAIDLLLTTTARPYKNNQIVYQTILRDISVQKRTAQERENLINNLKQALAEVKTLQGFIPICASCKKIRDDKGYWNQIESYIREHSDAEFSHGICPECAVRLYKEYSSDK